MIRDLKPYPAMKDSGVPWLGEVPEHWELLPLKHWVKMNAEVLQETTAPDHEFRYLDIGSVGTGFLTQKPQRLRFGKAPSRARRVVHNGDTIVSTVRTYLKAIYFIEEDADDLICSTGFAVLTPRPETLPKFVSYVAQSCPFTDRVTADSVGTAYPAIAETRLGSFHVVVPPLPEQAAIVRFLDHADQRIRRYIRAKQKLIKLLEEQKQVIIHRAVTRGLDPKVRLKPSGVQWLGDVPEHWEVTRLKAVLTRPMRNGLFKKKDVFGSGVPLVNVADVYRDNFQIGPASLERVQATPDEVRTFQVQSGDLFFVRSSLKLEGTGRSAVAIGCASDSVFECHLVQGRPDRRRAKARFLAFQLNSFALRHYLISRANAVTMATVTQDVLASCPVLLPSVSEQERLLQQIDGECERVDAAIARAHREISLLGEYRTRLIADVVTGKLDVREAAARLPDEIEEHNDVGAIHESPLLPDEEEAATDDLDAVPEEGEA